MSQPHHFEITVRMWADDVAGSPLDATLDSPLVTQHVRAYSLAEALEKAREIPLPDWFEDEEE
jgi:hypothetical protein